MMHAQEILNYICLNAAIEVMGSSYYIGIQGINVIYVGLVIVVNRHQTYCS